VSSTISRSSHQNPADAAALGLVPPPLLQRRRAPGIANRFRFSVGHGLRTADDALIAGGSVAALRAIAQR